MKKIIGILLSIAMMCMMLCATAASGEESGFSIHFIDVGQADATVILCDGEVLMIDGGNVGDSSLIYSYLTRTLGLSVLSDEVATQLRRQKLKGSVIQVQIKTPALKSYSRQITLDHYTHLQKEILDTAMQLVQHNWSIGESSPIRALTVGMTHLLPDDQVSEQLTLFDIGMGIDGMQANRERQEKLEAAVDRLRQKHGSNTITRGFRDNEDIGIVRHKKEK